MRKHSRLRQFFFQTIQFLDGILYNILLLFGGLFISGGLRQQLKWPIASAGPGQTRTYPETLHQIHFWITFFRVMFILLSNVIILGYNQFCS